MGSYATNIDEYRSGQDFLIWGDVDLGIVHCFVFLVENGEG